ncbi:hypothetical protein F8M41_002967 [Gigaspora margarita]|uniref:Uncharacterized protein n=1 Tax=Gigaspora margarita TaxID=4874 RepID=A0A8H3XEH3_GIGMA|nr:hypothetical protein F8M41_002967 [Gigaspora margarita]
MPHQKLTGPCAIKDCTSSVKSFKNVIQDLKDKTNKYFDSQFNYLKVNQDKICFEHYMNDIIETIKIISNNTPIDNDYLKIYEEQQYIDLDINNFLNIKIKIVDNGVFIN